MREMVCVFAVCSMLSVAAAEDAADKTLTRASKTRPSEAFVAKVDAAAEAVSDLENALGEMTIADKVNVLETLGHAETFNAKVVRILSALSQDDSERIRIRVIVAARRLQLPQWKQWAREALSGSDAAMRARTLTIMSVLGEYEFIPDMLSGLKDSEPVVRAAAVVAVGNIMERFAIDLCTVLVDTSSDSDVKMSAAAALVRLQKGTARARDFLRDIMQDRQKPQANALRASYFLLLAGDVQGLKYFLLNYNADDKAHFIMGVLLESNATALFGHEQLVPYISGNWISVAAIRRWAEANEWKLIWDNENVIFTSMSEPEPQEKSK